MAWAMGGVTTCLPGSGAPLAEEDARAPTAAGAGVRDITK